MSDKAVTEIVNACDAAREGELISKRSTDTQSPNLQCHECGSNP